MSIRKNRLIIINDVVFITFELATSASSSHGGYMCGDRWINRPIDGVNRWRKAMAKYSFLTHKVGLWAWKNLGLLRLSECNFRSRWINERPGMWNGGSQESINVAKLSNFQCTFTWINKGRPITNRSTVISKRERNDNCNLKIPPPQTNE